jgi:predicted phosphodiesterase
MNNLKIAFASDLHLEFRDIRLKNDNNADVLCLCGDIFVSKDLAAYDEEYANFRSMRIHDFLIDCANNFNHVILVAGNHTFYHGDFHSGITNMKTHLSYIKNLHILDNESVDIDGVLFIGSTMWSDMNKEDPETIRYINRSMNDFRVIQNSKSLVEYKVAVSDDSDNPATIDPYTGKGIKYERRYRLGSFTPYDAIDEFHKSTKFIRDTIDENQDKKIVVITHHSPSYSSISPIYEYDSLMNGGYHSNCESLMKDNVILWGYGHTHNPHSYYIGDTLLVCNPRGYDGHEACADKFKLITIDIDDRPTTDEIKNDQYWEFHPEL